MQIVNCSNYFGSNTTVALRMWGPPKKIDFLCNFTTWLVKHFSAG